jgi:hypothetical protein
MSELDTGGRERLFVLVSSCSVHAIYRVSCPSSRLATFQKLDFIAVSTLGSALSRQMVTNTS